MTQLHNKKHIALHGALTLSFFRRALLGAEPLVLATGVSAGEEELLPGVLIMLEPPGCCRASYMELNGSMPGFTGEPRP